MGCELQKSESSGSVGNKREELEHHESESFKLRVGVRVGVRRGKLYIYIPEKQHQFL